MILITTDRQLNMGTYTLSCASIIDKQQQVYFHILKYIIGIIGSFYK